MEWENRKGGEGKGGGAKTRPIEMGSMLRLLGRKSLEVVREVPINALLFC